MTLLAILLNVGAVPASSRYPTITPPVAAPHAKVTVEPLMVAVRLVGAEGTAISRVLRTTLASSVRAAARTRISIDVLRARAAGDCDGPLRFMAELSRKWKQ